MLGRSGRGRRGRGRSGKGRRRSGRERGERKKQLSNTSQNSLSATEGGREIQTSERGKKEEEREREAVERRLQGLPMMSSSS